MLMCNVEISHDKFSALRAITPIFYQNVPWYPFMLFTVLLPEPSKQKSHQSQSTRLVIFHFVVLLISSHKFLPIVFYLDQHHHDVNERTLA